MTLDVFIRMLQSHLAALNSNEWPQPHGPVNGPAFFLDEEDTRALIAELTRVRDQAAAGTPAVKTAGPAASTPAQR
jgi:hypothetical protein